MPCSSSVVASHDCVRPPSTYRAATDLKGKKLEPVVAWRGTDLMASAGRVIRELRARGLKPPRTRRARRGDRLIRWESWERPRRTDGDSWGPRRETVGGDFDLVVDEVGLGGGVVDRLKELGFPVTAYNGGATPCDRDRYVNVRAEAYFAVRELLQDGTLALAANETLAEELLAVRWRVTSAGKVQLESKDDTRAKLGRSPDLADALAMSCWAFRRPGVPTLPPLKWG